MSIPESFGNTPAIVKWNVVRGDTARLRVDFLENNEETVIDIDEWNFASTTYDNRGDILDSLTVEVENGYVNIIATPEITSFWGSGYNGTIAEIAFDLEVQIGDIIWTPILGTIKVAADVTAGTL
jgi:hypothetical protein